MEGNMRGPSSLDCEKSFARTGIPSANMIAKSLRSSNETPTSNPMRESVSFSGLVQITARV
jgi:hypothetical protein